MTSDLLLISAALIAGLINAVAGGGSFFTFPALVYPVFRPSSQMRPARLRFCPVFSQAPGDIATIFRDLQKFR
jgi:hypothetical protein